MRFLHNKITHTDFYRQFFITILRILLSTMSLRVVETLLK